MKIEIKNDYARVTCEPADIDAFNKTHNARLPECEEYNGIQFGFKRDSGDLLRVIPNHVRQGGLAWEALRDWAQQAWRAQQ